jgi:hypothetical protein
MKLFLFYIRRTMFMKSAHTLLIARCSWNQFTLYSSHGVHEMNLHSTYHTVYMKPFHSILIMGCSWNQFTLYWSYCVHEISSHYTDHRVFMKSVHTIFIIWRDFILLSNKQFGLLWLGFSPRTMFILDILLYIYIYMGEDAAVTRLWHNKQWRNNEIRHAMQRIQWEYS